MQTKVYSELKENQLTKPQWRLHIRNEIRDNARKRKLRIVNAAQSDFAGTHRCKPRVRPRSQNLVEWLVDTGPNLQRHIGGGGS